MTLEITILSIIEVTCGLMILTLVRDLFSGPFLGYVFLLMVWIGLATLSMNNANILPLWVHTEGTIAFVIGIASLKFLNFSLQSRFPSKRKKAREEKPISDTAIIFIIFWASVGAAVLYFWKAGIPLFHNVWQSKLEAHFGLGPIYRLATDVLFISSGALVYALLVASCNTKPGVLISWLVILAVMCVALFTGYRTNILKYSLTLIIILMHSGTKAKRIGMYLIVLAVGGGIFLTYLYLHGAPTAQLTVVNTVLTLWHRMTYEAAVGADYLVRNTEISGHSYGTIFLYDLNYVCGQIAGQSVANKSLQPFTVGLYTRIKGITGPNPGFATTIATPAYFYSEFSHGGVWLGMILLGLGMQWIWQRFTCALRRPRAFKVALWAFLTVIGISLLTDAPTPAKLYYTVVNALLVALFYILLATCKVILVVQSRPSYWRRSYSRN